MDADDTIAAISTPPGEGAVALIRISGPEALPIASRILKAMEPVCNWPARRSTFAEIIGEGVVMDQVLATVFRSPHSYTSEDMVEIACHGGIFLAAQILELVLHHGARAAEPGEFTRRAFIHGKLDLTRAEAVMDLIRARTPLALRSAAEQLEGRLGREVNALRAEILATLAHLEAWIDFPEEDIDPATGTALLAQMQETLQRVEKLLATAGEGRLLREGVRVAIVGRPNAGKSSLLNRLLGMDRAIVSPIPGTTRDTIEETACLKGILFRLTDTAGLRSTEDPVEKQGVERSRKAMDHADLILHVVDAAEDFEAPALNESELLVANKCDLLAPDATLPPHAIRVSSLTGQGLDTLVDRLVEEAGGRHLTSGQSLAAVNARHQALLESAAKSLRAAAGLVARNQAPELTAMELRAALDAVGRIVGAADTEELLGEIFGTFCIGK